MASRYKYEIQEKQLGIKYLPIWRSSEHRSFDIDRVIKDYCPIQSDKTYRLIRINLTTGRTKVIMRMGIQTRIFFNQYDTL